MKNRIWLLIALLLAFGVRVFRLNGQSLWNDEGTSIALAALDVNAIANAAARDIHPPLYYLLLHYWIPFAGTSEFGVRLLSVLAGTLVVALTFRLARDFFDLEVALDTAFISALAVFQVYYSQETRMYIWVTLWATLSVFFFTRVWFRRGQGGAQESGDVERSISTLKLPRGALIAYILCTAAALYTHYLAPAILAVENAFFFGWILVGWLIPRFRNSTSGSTLRKPFSSKEIVMFVAAQVIIVLLFVPWLAFAGNQITSWPSISEPFTLLDLFWRLLGTLATGGMLDDPNALILAFAFGVFFVGGLLPSQSRTEHMYRNVLLAVIWVFVPVILLYIISLQRPAYNPKFLLFITPAFYLLVGRGLANLYPGLFLRERYRGRYRPFSLRTVVFVVAAAFSALIIVALQNYEGDPRFARDDYRSVIAYINRVATAHDAVLVNAPGQLDVVKYYLHSEAHVEGLPVGRPLDRTLTLERLDALTANYRRLYAVIYAPEQSDPQDVIGGRLSAVAFKASDEWHGNMRLAQYGLPALMQTPLTMTLEARLGEEIVLSSFAMGTTALRAGDILPLRFNWRVMTNPRARYKIFVHLVDGARAIVAQHDAEPFEGVLATDQWRAGDAFGENFAVVLPLDIAPGDYGLEFGVYRIDNGQRLLISGATGISQGDHLSLGSVSVIR